VNKLTWLNLLLLIAGTLLLLACGPVVLSQPIAFQPGSTAALPPTEASTAIPFSTSTAVTPPAAYATEQAAAEATIVARATVSPVPTADPPTVESGQPSVAVTRRDGLAFELCLPKDTYLAGEGGRAEVTLSNEGSESFFIDGDCQHAFWLALLDERGQKPPAWPWPAASFPCPPYLNLLAPGQILTATLEFQVPPPGLATSHSFVLWTETRFSRPVPDNPQGPDNLWLHLETGPIPLRLAVPGPEQELQAELRADRDGWSLHVTDAQAQRPAGALWGWLDAASSNGSEARPLADTPTGSWSASWDPYLAQNGAAVAVRAWVAAPGYVTAAVTATVPGTGDASREFYTPEPPQRQTFSSLAVAQAALDFPVYRPGALPQSAVLDGIEVDTWIYEGGRRVEVRQAYRLADDAWLELTQTVTTPPYEGSGWGQARWAPEAEPVHVGQAEGYAVQRCGCWLLDWKCGDVGLELQAPATVVPLEEMVTLAAGVQSPEGFCAPAPTAMPQPTPPGSPALTP
jgi:hypothetical protein